MPRTRHVYVVAIIAFASANLAAQPLSFGDHPRLTYTFPEAFAESAPLPGSADALERWQKLIRSAEKIVETPIDVPTEGGQWVFYYACPEHNCSLHFRDGKHICPKCGKEYTDERTRLAHVTIQHNAIDGKLLTLAKAWTVSRRAKFAEDVFRVLTRYAELYPKWGRHDRWGRKGLLAVIGGKRHCQSLSDAVGVIKLAQAYDLVHDWEGADKAVHAKIAKGLFREAVDTIYAFYLVYDGRNNHMTWYNAAAATVGAAIGDEAYVRKAVDGKKGLRWQFRNSVAADGLWYEGTISYHFYALQAVVETVRAARAVGLDLTDEPALRKLYLAPLQLAYPNGQFPAFNDGDRMSIAGRRRDYAFAAATWDDPVLKHFAETGEVPRLDSAVYEEAGLAYLRRGTGADAVVAVLDFGQHGGHHGHPDKLNLMLYALGREVFLDPGRLTYRCPEHETWTRQTVAHNTVVIDRRSQLPVPGRLLHFERNDHWDSVVAESATVYPGVVLRRALILFDTALVDFYHVKSAKTATIDWILHGVAELATPGESTDVSEPLGATAGYQHLSDLREAEPSDPFTIDWRLPGGSSLQTHVRTDGSATVVTGNGIGYTLTQKVPFIMLRKRGREARFHVVHHWGDGLRAPPARGSTDSRLNLHKCRLALSTGTWSVTWHDTGRPPDIRPVPVE